MGRLERHMETAKKWTLTSLRNRTARALQKAIRAEAGAFVGNVRCVVKTQMATVHSPAGYCVCVTCGTSDTWNSGGIHAGHFLPGRSPHIVCEEVGIHPQCNYCNTFKAGAPMEYRVYMNAIYGVEVIERLEELKAGFVDGKRVEPPGRVELVEMRMSYLDRIRDAERKLKTLL